MSRIPAAARSELIPLPENPRQGDVVQWWTMQHHPGSSYVQRHRATYYADAACGDVLGKDYKGGRRFDREWLIETWYEPSGSKSSGGRNTTDGLRRHLTTGPASGSVHLTWAGARDAAAANMRERAAEFRSMAECLERDAIKLEEAPTPKGFQ
jgi:hypothetical protein